MKLNTVLINQETLLKSIEGFSKELLLMQRQTRENKCRLNSDLTTSSVESSFEINEQEEVTPFLTVNYKGEDLPLFLPETLEWKIAGCQTIRGTIRLLLCHLHDMKSLLSFTLTGASSSKERQTLALPELTYLYIQLAIRKKFKLNPSENTLAFEKAQEQQMSNTRMAIGKVLQDLKSSYELNGKRKRSKKEKLTSQEANDFAREETDCDEQGE